MSIRHLRYWLIILSFAFTLNSIAQDSKTWALIMGIDKYENIKGLKHAVRDAELFEKFLKTKTGGSLDSNHIRTLYNEKVTQININKGFEWLEIQGVDTSDIVFIFYSGHGAQVNSTNTGYLPVYDYVPNTPQRLHARYDYYHLNQQLAILIKKHVTVHAFIDACYSGSFIEGHYDKIIQDQSGTKFQDYQRYLNRFASSQWDEKSKEDTSSLRQGVFSHYLLKGLFGEADAGDKDKIITNFELSDYVYKMVKEYGIKIKQKDQYSKANFKEGDSRVSQIVALHDKSNDDMSKTFEIKAPTPGSVDQPILFASASKSIGSKYLDNPRFKLLIDSFEFMISKKILVDPSESSGNSAVHFYNKIIDLEPDKRLKFELTTKLSVALDSHAQQVLNGHMVNINNQPTASEFKTAAREISLLLTLMDKEDPLYDNINTRKVFLEAYTIIREKDIKNYPKAKVLLNSIKTRSGETPEFVLNALGVISDNLGEYDKAIQYFESAISSNENWVLPKQVY